jgi:ATP-dependent DNA helicase RecQ
VAGGFLDVDAEAYGALTLNEKSWQVLRKQQEVRLREDPLPAPRSRNGNSGAKRNVPALTGEDAEAFEALRVLRKRVAEEQGLPPFVIFHDATLREMVAARPRSLADLARVKGVGETKLKKYGPLLLEVLRAR